MSAAEEMGLGSVPDGDPAGVLGPDLFGPIAADLVDAAAVVDEQGRLVAATPGALSAFDWPEPPTVGTPVADIVHPADRGRAAGRLGRLPPGSTTRIDVRLLAAGGSYRWFELVVSDRRAVPAIGGVVVAAHDIDDRVALQQELQRSEAYISSLVQNASDVIMVLDAMVRVRYASPSAQELFGYSTTKLIGRNVLDLIHVEDREVVADRFLDAAHTSGQTAYLDFRVVDREGIERRVEAAATNLLDHPATNGIVVNLRDLGPRDRSREVLERSERRFRKLIANISDTITLVDSTGRVLMITGDADEVLGHPNVYWPGQSVLDIVHPDDHDRAIALQASVLTHLGEPVSGQFRMLHADGSWVDVEVTIVNLLDDADVAGAVITSRNISPHKAVERALSEAHRQALDALAAKAEFVAQVGHEVRTPIHGIVGLAELLGDADLDEESRRLVAAIRRSGEGLSIVINDLLDFSKIEAGRVELVDGVLSPHRLVADVVDILRPQADERGLVLEGLVGARVPPFIRGDELRLRQVIVNLVGNAVKYTDEGTVRVSVDTVEHSGDTFLLRFDVADTGLGIPPDEIPRLFQPFTQSSATAGSGRVGTGLGLTVSRQLVELMGGEISVTSQLGVGSTFSFTLPTVAGVPERLPSGQTRPERLPEQRGRVLVVEDSPVNQALIERQLIRLGCEAVVAPTGVEALGLMDQMAFDLVLMDRQLPGIDGLETTRRWRAQENPSGTRLPIVAMTASAAPGVQAECLEAGMDGFLAKPARLEDVGSVLDRFLRPVGGPPALAAGDDGEPREPTDSGAEPAVLDRAVLATLVEEVGDPAIAASVVATFLGELDGRLAVLGSPEAQLDREALERTAHTLRSTSRALGAAALAAACDRLELIAPDPSIPPAALVAEVVKIAGSTASALRHELQVLQAPAG
jgi:PAS domain S-box-containing protein